MPGFFDPHIFESRRSTNRQLAVESARERRVAPVLHTWFLAMSMLRGLACSAAQPSGTRR
jgi:hypothetical protein